jgi:catechol 2,3-dioxygenase
MTNATENFDMSAAPMRIGRVTLKVRDLDRVSDFYRDAIGLAVLAKDGRRATLGTDSAPLLVLEGDPGVAPSDRQQAGLFHTAFLLPTRADLARWLRHVADARVPLQGASDHIVSEALYVSDPEGNGIEVYVDRPVPEWLDDKGKIQMTTDPLDVQDLLAAGEGSAWNGFPEDGSIGHVHLRVGDTAEADRFYRDVLGFDVTVDYPGASFYGSGGYHHQLAGNVWSSRGASRRTNGEAGLDSVEIIVRDTADIEAVIARAKAAELPVEIDRDGTTTLRDPWGASIKMRA